MKTIGEALLAAFALAAIYCCAVPRNLPQTGGPTIGAEQVVLVADGSDPMPVCRGKTCK
jgi:hypothetical protein